jgi:hypothetical protein
MFMGKGKSRISATKGRAWHVKNAANIAIWRGFSWVLTVRIIFLTVRNATGALFGGKPVDEADAVPRRPSAVE